MCHPTDERAPSLNLDVGGLVFRYGDFLFKRRSTIPGNDLEFIFAGFDEQSLPATIKLVHVSHEFAVEIDGRELVGTFYPQFAKGRLRGRQGLQPGSNGGRLAGPYG